jgi:hypothetical protein
MKINELISDTDTRNLNAQGYEVVDQIEIDNYNIALTRMPAQMAPMLGAEYQLGFSKEGTDFTDYTQQTQKFIQKNEKFPLGKLAQGLNTVRQWISEYGPIAIASSNLNKTKVYAKIFNRAKFSVTPKEGMGTTWLIIE